MKVGSYSATIGSMEQQKRLDVIANNIANTNTPGFKKDSVHFSSLLGIQTHTSLEQGPIRDTGHKMDIALSGKGFLKVQGEGKILYTRAGNLTLDASKNLVMQDGRPVLGKNGPIRIENAGNLRIEEDGQVFDDKTQVGTLDIVGFSGDQVRKNQGGYFEPTSDDIQPTAARECKVRQGALEEANFNPVEEMVRMMEATRNFEAYQKTLQINDRDLDGQVIQKLAG